MRRFSPVLALTLLAALMTIGPVTAAEQSTLQPLLDELTVIVNQARANRSADARLLDELQNFIDEHDRPWTRQVLFEDFRDGELNRSPRWTQTAGQHRVDARYGMIATPTAVGSDQARGKRGNAEAVNALLGALLSQAQGNKGNSSDSQQRDSVAQLETGVTIANSFSMNITLGGTAQGAQAAFGAVQGQLGSVSSGYWLVIAADTVSIERRSSRGASVVANVARPASGSEFEWTRSTNGNMRVTANGQTLIESSDRGIRNGFTRVVIESRNAEVAVRELKIMSAS
jgi:hypothetical protein